MTLALVVSVVGIAVVDSVNPSALAMTAYLLTLDDPWARIGAYLAGIALLYFSIGCIVVFALGDAVNRIIEALGSPEAKVGLQALVGTGALAAGTWVLVRRRRRRAGTAAPAVPTPLSAFVLGLAVTAVEATTALPYLGALAIVVRADVATLPTLALLGLYTAIFVLPPTALTLAVRTGAGQRLHARLTRPSQHDTKLRLALGAAGLLLGALLLVEVAMSVASRSA